MKEKIYIIGASIHGVSKIAMAKIKDAGFDIEMVSPENIPKNQIFERPPIPIINTHPVTKLSQPPLTRQQRRAKERKNKR